MINIEVGSRIKVNVSGIIRNAKIRKIGPVQEFGYHMLTLEIGGETGYCPVQSHELSIGAMNSLLG